MKILIITDAAPPQINGVVVTLRETIRMLREFGHEVLCITPNDFKTVGLPGYREIQIPISTKGLRGMMTNFDPDHIHLATEGRLGWAARKICLDLKWAFTTAYHSDFPQFLRHYFVPTSLTYHFLQKFHSVSSAVMVSTPSIEHNLIKNGFARIKRWTRGVDRSKFHPKARIPTWPQPVFMYVGRISPEKSIDDFLCLDLPGTKIVVGGGPLLDSYRSMYPAVIFLGPQPTDKLPELYSKADCFVFPSKSDTFGLVLIEAMACGTPVAAYPVQGPLDVVPEGAGVLNDDLGEACAQALKLDRSVVEQLSQQYTWEVATQQFLDALVIK